MTEKDKPDDLAQSSPSIEEQAKERANTLARLVEEMAKKRTQA